MRGSQEKGLGKRGIYMVSAWAEENHLVLGQRKVDEKSNEITAIPELLKILALSVLVSKSLDNRVLYRDESKTGLLSTDNSAAAETAL